MQWTLHHFISPALRMLRHLINRWNNWLGDSSLERAIRDQLVRQGYPRQASQIQHARMVAIERPGWVQVWRFTVVTKHKGDDGLNEVTLFGAARDDGRCSTSVLLSTDQRLVHVRLAEWSEGLIVRRR